MGIRRSSRVPCWRRAVLLAAMSGAVLASDGDAQLPESPRLPGLPSPLQVPIRLVAPTLQITTPPENATFQEDRVRFLGAASASTGVADVEVTVNGRRFPLRDFQAGFRHVTIEAQLDLVPGENIINIVVRDGAGGRTFAQRRVLRSMAGIETVDRWAVVIGVRKYDHGQITPRRFGDRDAQAVFEMLTVRAGFKRTNVRLLADGGDAPTLANIRRALGEWLPKNAGPRDSVVVYFAGRGAKDDDRAYLLPRDADMVVPEQTALDLEALEGMLGKVNARYVMVVLDAPFGTVPGSIAGSTVEQQYLTALTRRAGRVVFVASENEDTLELAALRHGLFTHYFLRALDGDADANRDGVVSGAELRDHLEIAVGDHADSLGTKQRPVVHGSTADVPVLIERPATPRTGTR